MKQEDNSTALLEFLSNALSHTGGKVFLKIFLLNFPFLGTYQPTDGIEAAYNEGRRAAGVMLYRYLFMANAEGLTNLLKEMGQDERHAEQQQSE
jgi:hypothetical protein